MKEVTCPKCESTIHIPKVALLDEPVRCPECDFALAVEAPAQTLAATLPTHRRGYLERRRPLKRFVLACSAGYFLFAVLLVTIEQIKGTPHRPHPENFGATILAVIGLIWATREDKPKGE